MNDVDLIVSSVTAPPDVFIYDGILLSWTVTNLGINTASSDWFDAVYISDDQFLDNSDTSIVGIWVGENTPLASLGSYTISQYVYPRTKVGDRYLLFVADSSNNQSETNETNNVFAQPITITGPDVDLVVTAANAPTTALLNETISVSWTVKNVGTETAFSNWFDTVAISDDQFLDDSDTYLKFRWTEQNETPLASGGSYTATLDIDLPSDLAIGNRYLLFLVNLDNIQAETNDDNNIFVQPITINAPDLAITDVNAPSTALLNETIFVSWTVKNLGTSTAFADWYDSVYISDDQFFDYSDRFLTGRSAENYTPLAAGSSYTITEDIQLSSDLATGDVYDGLRQRYLLFVADASTYQDEANETNNVFAKAITISAPDVDLVVTSAQAPTTAAIGEKISLSWTVNNQGTNIAFADWYDAVYISDDQFFDYSDRVLSEPSAENYTPLAAGSSYTVTQETDIYFYQAEIGDRYLLFVADSTNQQSETNETNNVFAQPITITASDLAITDVNAPIISRFGQTITLSWTVTNLGTGSAFRGWRDSVYISDDQFLDYGDSYYGIEGDTLLTRFDGTGNTPLAVGSSYTIIRDVPLSGITPGDYYLFFVTSSYADTNQTNNIFVQAITINPPDLDLVVTAANAPTAARLNEGISVSWTVKNQGTDTAFANWYDLVYVSNDEFFDENDVSLTSRSVDDYVPLAGGSSYTATEQIYLSENVVTGDVYLLFVADIYDWQAETNETNNVFAQAITIINDPLEIDLVVSDANAPTAASLGETITLSWTVTNQGVDTAFSNWRDIVYLSKDQFFDSTDRYLTDAEQFYTPLTAGNSYTITRDIQLQSNLAVGDYYLLFVTDTRNTQGETNDDNNVFAKAITINAPDVPDVPDVDLVVFDANAPTTAAVGEKISLSWTVKNLGTDTALGYWYDYVYFSDDQFLDYTDRSITYDWAGGYTPLAAGSSYTATRDITIPRYIATGDVYDGLRQRYLLFVTDEGNNQSETNESNNVFAQAITLTIPDVELKITTASAPTSATLGETISVSWTVKNLGTDTAFADWFDEVYIFSSINYQFYPFKSSRIAQVPVEENTPLAPGSSYTITLDIGIPLYDFVRSSYADTYAEENLIGDVYLLFVTNSDNAQIETGGYYDETRPVNNELFVPITINAPDLVVSAAQAPTTTTSGETISVSWTVTNQGTGSALAKWDDYVYISKDQFLDKSDTFVGSRSVAGDTPLAVGSSYTATQDITIPIGEDTGDVYDGLRQRYLLFVADNYYYDNEVTGIGNQGETNRYNNVRAVAISLYAEDQIFKGTSARDTLTGDDRNNLIVGLQGADTLTGGAGSDRFLYTSIRDAGDTITDFVAGTDKIDLSQLFQSLNLGSLDYESATTQGYLSFGTHLSNSTALIDIDGTAGRGRATPLLTVAGVSASTLAQSDNFVF
ncbi:MAG: type I secretion C-terminal target domain-containing protein [Desmonostoc geniculatum HA4340-LM1]|jgi:subtilase family serine protease|nr:type I secretion C-terminal target domain-containing protein [Desmonostoc geniculatum HA4340-LM1]